MEMANRQSAGATKEQALELYREQYPDYGPAQAAEGCQTKMQGLPQRTDSRHESRELESQFESLWPQSPAPVRPIDIFTKPSR